MLVTSATPDTRPEHALNTPKALHKHFSTPVNDWDTFQTRQRYFSTFGNAPFYATLTSKARPQLVLNTFSIRLTRQDKVYTSKISNESQRVGTLSAFSKRPAHVCGSNAWCERVTVAVAVATFSGYGQHRRFLQPIKTKRCGSECSRGNLSMQLCLWVFFVCSEFYGPVNTTSVISSRSIYLTTLFLDKLIRKRITSTEQILSQASNNCPFWISGRYIITVEKISWSLSMKECCQPCKYRTRDLLITSPTRILQS